MSRHHHTIIEAESDYAYARALEEELAAIDARKPVADDAPYRVVRHVDPESEDEPIGTPLPDIQPMEDDTDEH